MLKFINDLVKKDIKIWAENNKIRYHAPDGRLTDEEKNIIHKNHSLIISLLNETNHQKSNEAKKIDIKYPLSYGQKALWLFQQINPNRIDYNLTCAVNINYNLDILILQNALNKLAKKQPIINSIFDEENGEPFQIIKDSCELIIEEKKILNCEKDNLYKEIYKEADAPFDLRKGPLLVVKLFRLPDDKSILLIVSHHIISDFLSLNIFLKELRLFYEEEVKFTKKIVQSNKTNYTYMDHIYSQRQFLTSTIGTKQKAYWINKLSGKLPVIEFPLDHPRPKFQTFNGNTNLVKICNKLVSDLKELSSHEGVTLFVTLLTAFKLLIYKYTGESDILIGTPVTERSLSKFRTIGYFVNPVLLRTTISESISFKELMKCVNETVNEAMRNKDYPFPLLVEQLNIERDPSRFPIFQNSFTFVKMPLLQDNNTYLFEMEPFLHEQRGSAFDISFMVTDNRGDFQILCNYNTDIFEESTIKRIMKHYERILESVINKPEERIGQIKLLSKEEEEEIIGKQSGETVEYPKDKCIHNMFEEQVERTPDRIAVEYKEEKLTYKELNERSNQLAHYLQENGVGPDVAVGLYTERSLEMVIGLLGILKAGGAYVPLDPLFPKDRLSYIINETKMSIIVTNKNGEDDLLKNKKVIYLSNEKENTQKWKTQNLNKRIKTNHLAYIIFTSGSTGNPKGVRINHNSLTNFLVSMKEKPGIKSEDRLLAITTISFDIAALEIYLPLITGSGLIVASRETVVDGNLLSKRIKESKITIMQATPSSWQMLLESDWEGDSKFKALCGGEALSKGLAEKLLKKCGSLWNMYGPTETTIWSSIYEVKKERNEVNNEVLVSIGKPINNTQFYVLDKNLQMVPYGVIGELYIGGEGISKGYYNRVEMTAEKFIPDLYGKSSGKCLYKTGDYVKLLENGEMEFLGRMDHQVKIRGYRIELGEIESVLESDEEIKQSVVIVKATENNNKQLVAYIVPTKAEQIRVEEVREYVTQKLPSYMAPSIYVILDEMPLTPNSKIDRKKLPDPVEYGISTTKEYVGAQTETQIKLSEIWTNLLGLKQVSINDNFFEIGGHSLLATQLISRIRDVFLFDISLQKIFELPNILDLSKYLDSIKQDDANKNNYDIQVYPRTQDLELSFSQERLWFLDQLEQFSGAYNISSAMKLEGNISVPILEKSLNEIIKRHEVLRTTFITKNNKPIQIVHNELLLSIPVIVLTKMNKEEQEKQIKQIIHEETSYHFDLSTGPLLRVIVVNLNETQNILIITMHHIIVDGWSLGLLIKELSIIYNAFLKNKPSPLCDLPVQYADYAIWQRGWIKGEISEKQMNYWKEKLTGSPTVIELPLDKTRLKIQGYKGKREIFKIEKWKTEKIKQLSNTNNVTLFMTLLTIFKILLYRYSNQTDIVVGTPVANRKHSKIESLVGFFVNTLVLRTEVSGEISFKELVERVKKTTIEAYNNQDMPFEQIVEKVQPERSLSYSPLFQVMFILQNQRMEEFSLEGIEISQLESEHITSKFDITLTFSETEKGLIGNLEYNTDIFEESTIKRIMKHYERILESVINKPEERIDQIKLLSKEEEEEIIGKQSGETVEYPKDKCIHNMFEEQVERTPDRIAVEYKEEKLTYKELNERSNQLAHYLQENGVGPDVAVGLYTERSLEMVIGLLGILKAGGAYVPLDINNPKQRIDYMIENAKISVLLTQKKLINNLSITNISTTCIDSDWDKISKNLSISNPRSNVNPDNLLYIIFTSGSTGSPKAAGVYHKGFVNLMYWFINEYKLSENDEVLLITSLSFDLTQKNIFGPLMTGGILNLCGSELFDPEYILNTLSENKITWLNCTPSMFYTIIDQKENAYIRLNSLRYIFLGGEAVSIPKMKKWIQSPYFKTKIINLYGPTETTSVCSHYNVDNPQKYLEKNLPIGQPINNARIMIIDKNHNFLPIGIPGELCIAGEGVGAGYLNDEKQKKEKFVVINNNIKIYKSGDLARLLPDGNIEFLGRLDHQVKIRGFRIELEEIDFVIKESQNIKNAVTIVYDHKDQKYLISYVVPENQNVTSEQLKSFLKNKLPDYMIPPIIIMIKEMPLTPNGKINRFALPSPKHNIENQGKKKHEKPNNEIEYSIASIIEEILQKDKISISDNFFEIGVHSLTATQIVSRINNKYNIIIPIRIFFEKPTIKELADYIKKTILSSNIQNSYSSNLLNNHEELVL
jgi:amino acid adenylation domain-containing protein